MNKNTTGLTIDSAMPIWRSESDAGDGFSVGRENDGNPSDMSCQKAVENEGWETLEISTEGYVLALRPDGVVVMVCDCHGPWGCVVSTHTRHAQG